MPNKHWILVGNGARARVFSRNGERPNNWGLTAEAEFAHDASRMKGSELVSDRPGSARGHGNDSGKFVPRTDPKRNEIEHFARELVRELVDAHHHGKFTRLTLVASNPLLGLLSAQLPGPVMQTVDARLAHDYTLLAPRDLQVRLKELMGPPAG
ncbi:MAG TPA: host attachment protein [Burkholderiaceae bacterium]|nr:host attachment protein [Burkholderiaceae bacterium]